MTARDDIITRATGDMAGSGDDMAYDARGVTNCGINDKRAFLLLLFEHNGILARDSCRDKRCARHLYP